MMKNRMIDDFGVVEKTVFRTKRDYEKFPRKNSINDVTRTVRRFE